MKFSQRIGIVPVRTALQVESIDSPLLNRIWNSILRDFFEKLDGSRPSINQSPRIKVSKFIWEEFFNKRIDEFPLQSYVGASFEEFLNILEEWYFNAKWYEVYDFVEFLSKVDQRTANMNFIPQINNALEKELAGYRIIDSEVVQITSEAEIAAIEEAMVHTNKWQPVSTHLKTALEYLADRKSPDYRNSIKESISAVESFCSIITGEKNTTLGKALTAIEKRWQIHGALKTAFSALYGYTSDAGGIRHSLLEDTVDITFEDAKFMLVSCTAFINYLTVRIEK